MAAELSARPRLRAAHSAYQAALPEKAAAAKAADEGRTMVAEREAELAQLEAEGRALAADTASRILDAARSGTSQATVSPDGQASALVVAQHRVALAVDTLGALTENEAKADRELARTLLELKRAGAELLAQGGDLLADELRSLNDKATVVRATLLGLGMVRIEPDKPFPLSLKAREALSASSAQSLPAQDVVRIAQQSWRERYELLLLDPGADLELLLPRG